MDEDSGLMFSKPFTLKELAEQARWDKGSARAMAMRLMCAGELTRRLVPAGPLTTKRKVVYQFIRAVQQQLT